MKEFWSLARSWLMAVGIVALTACGGDDSGVEVTGGFDNEAGTELLADTFGATLIPAGQLPPNTSAAGGAGTVVIDPVTRETVAVVTTIGLDPTTVTLREGAPGEDGQIVLPLFETEPGSSVWTATAVLSDDQIEALRAGRFFFDVTSLAFPGGELVGRVLPQLATFASPPFAGIGDVPLVEFGVAPSQPVTLVAALRANQAVPATASVAQGSATVVVDPLTRQVSAAVATRGTVPTGVEIGLGAPGVPGTTVLTLTETGIGTGVWQAGGVLSAEEIEALLAGEGFIVVRSAAFPQGEIRGQLIPLRETPGLVGTPLPAPAVPTFVEEGAGVGNLGRPTVPPTGTPGVTTPGLGTPTGDPFGRSPFASDPFADPNPFTRDPASADPFADPNPFTRDPTPTDPFADPDPFAREPLGTEPLGTTSPLGSAPLGGFQTDPARLGIAPAGTGFGSTPSTGATGTTPGVGGIGDPLTPATSGVTDPVRTPVQTPLGAPLGTPSGTPLNTSPNDNLF